jgi:DNA-binding NtrC family response regulator
VLLVEDHPLLAAQAGMMLEEMGADNVLIVGTVTDALNALQSARFNLALLDLQLGDESGLIVAERCANADIPVILATGYGDIILPVRHSSEYLLRKPYSFSDLENLIHKIAAKDSG